MTKSMKMILWPILAIIVLFANDASSHVSLTFPPARKYELDFLDTFR